MGELEPFASIVQHLTQKTRLSGLRDLAEKIKAADPPLTEEEVLAIQEAVAWPETDEERAAIHEKAQAILRGDEDE